MYFLRSLLLGISLCLLMSGSIGCSRARVHPLSLYEYRAKPKSYDMPAYFGKVDRPHVPIAIIDSSPRETLDQPTKDKMLAEVKKAARKIGADAVHDARFIEGEGSGYVSDPATPFPSAKQGPYEMNYLRVEAIKFPDLPSAAQSQPTQWGVE